MTTDNMATDEMTTDIAKQKQRIVSLDAFRGLTIMSMILVNNPGQWGVQYALLKHAEWHGWTPTDMVFPFFLFIVGVAIPLSLGKRKATVAKGELVGHIVLRSAILFGLGLFLSGFGMLFKLGADFGVLDLFATLRIPGVLQRIAVCYLIVSLLFLYLKPKTLYAVTAAVLLGYWALLMWVPVPEYGAGMIDGKDTHLVAYLDRLVLGTNHLWSYAKTWDPEGLLSTLPALANTLFGVFVGLWLKRDQALISRLQGLLLAGALLVAVGWCWGQVFPINKPIWTSSYAVFSSGLAMLVLGLCVLVFDVLGWKRLAVPFQIYGVNALTVFVMSGVVGRLMTIFTVGSEPVLTLKSWLYQNLFQSWLPDDKNAALGFAIAWVACWFVVLAVMYRKNWIIKV